MANISTTKSFSVLTTETLNSSVDPYYIELSPYFLVLNIVYYAVLGPVAVIGNILSVAVSQRILRYRQSIPDMLTGTLAAFDLLCAVATHTPAVISMAEGQWTGGSYVCSYQYFMAWSCLKTSFFIIILLTIDRYLALVKPFYYRAKVTMRQMKIAVFALTLFSFASTSITVIWFSEEITLLPNWYLCMNTWGKGNQYYSYILAFYGLTFVIGVIIFNVCNTGIVCSLLRHSRKAQLMRLRVLSAAQDRRERRVAKVIEALSAVFMLFWLPYLVFIVLNQVGIFYSEFAEDLAIRVLFANTILNPVIYGLFNRTYRKAYMYFARKLLYFALCGQIKKPKEKRIFYLRRSYLQHRYARKTPPHLRGANNNAASDSPKPEPHAPMDNTVISDELDGSSILAASEIHHTALTNIGFIWNSEKEFESNFNEEKLESELEIFAISNREELRHPLTNGTIIKGRCTDGEERASEYLSSSDGEREAAKTDIVTESTWL